MDTEDIIANQLAENTGTHVMDSGGGRGRMWQRNQDRAEATGLTVRQMFDAGQPAYWDGYGVTLSTYHWMVQRLDHRADLQDRYDRWVNLSWVGLDRYDRGNETNSPATVDAYIDAMVAKGWMEEHPEFDGWTNTYNSENLLSQDLQFRCAAYTWEHPYDGAHGESVVFMSTHNGADARGGYSDFKIYSCDPWEMWDWDDFTAHCAECETRPAPPDTTLFDEKPYVAEWNGWWWHRGGSFETDGGDHGEPVFDPRWPGHNIPALELPDDFEQTGPICPTHLCNMEVSA